MKKVRNKQKKLIKRTKSQKSKHFKSGFQESIQPKQPDRRGGYERREEGERCVCACANL